MVLGMWTHAINWMQISTTVLEAILLLRVVALKLYRVYLFITLFCALNVLFDAVSCYFGWDSHETENIFIYTLFFFAVLYPFVAWDSFEESKTQIAKPRRLQTFRMVSGLLLTAICALIVGLVVDPTDPQGNSVMFPFMGVFLLTGAASGAAAFLWFLYRYARAQKIVLARNTFVWTVFFMLASALQILDCLEILTRSLLPSLVGDIGGVVLLTLDIALLAWCIFALRAASSDVASSAERANPQ